MATDEKQGRPNGAAETKSFPLVQTEGVPSLYSNLASLTVSFNDVRIYLCEVSPPEISVQPGSTQKSTRLPQVTPRLCVVLTPEFAKSLSDALTTTIAQYEE